MKNKDILHKTTEEPYDKLLSELIIQKKKTNLRRIQNSVVCVAFVICCMFLLVQYGEHNLLLQSSNPQDSITDTLSEPSSDNIYCLALAAYPEMPMYPDETDPDAVTRWYDARKTLRNQPQGYKEGFDSFFLKSTRVFLEGEKNSNIVYSPLSLYIALGMSAEITSGDTRQQILDVLCKGNINTLRSHSKSIWQANYMDDGMAKCVLSTSLWMNNNQTYNMNTIRSVADNYYT